MGDLIKAELSRLLIRDVADPAIQRVTITGVKVSADLRFARVFFVRLGEEGCTDETVGGLQRASGFLKRELGKNLKLRYVPEIEFSFDTSFDYGDRIERLLVEIQEEEEGNAGDAGQNS